MSKLDHAGLTVQDLGRSIEFYCTVLGCVVEERDHVAVRDARRVDILGE